MKLGKTINLVDSNKSDISYKISRFPDGQQNIVIDPPDGSISMVEIKSRLNNWLDLELIVCTVASLRELGIEEIYLYTPYILGARSDRKFMTGGNRYIKDVIAPVLNSLNFKSVFCLDPHSYVLENCINNLKTQSNYKLVSFTLDDLYQQNEYILIAPDAGASHKIYKLAEEIGYEGDIITCSKERDWGGNIIKTVVPMGKYWEREKDAIIVDDICDGGATFINIAKEMKANGWKNKIYLVVTHGIFSKGFGELSQYFDGIYCTNSYSDIEKQFKSFKEINGYEKDFVKQLNVF